MIGICCDRTIYRYTQLRTVIHSTVQCYTMVRTQWCLVLVCLLPSMILGGGRKPAQYVLACLDRSPFSWVTAEELDSRHSRVEMKKH